MLALAKDYPCAMYNNYVSDYIIEQHVKTYHQEISYYFRTDVVPGRNIKLLVNH